MNSLPLVSVLMTSYNREAFIGEAIESVLSSTYENFELIIVDDVSVDRTVEIAREYERKDKRVKVYENSTNLGDYPNRNKAASLASGKYLKYVDADDLVYSFGIQIAVEFTERFPDAGFGLGCYPDEIKPFPILVEPREIYLENFYKYQHFDRSPGSGLIKRDAFEKLNGFSGKRMVGDFEFWFKIGRYYPMVKLPIDLYWNRIHSGQESKTSFAKDNYRDLRAEVIKEALNHRDCPLSTQDLIGLRRYLRRGRIIENFTLGMLKLRRFLDK